MMIDAQARKKIRVHESNEAGPYMSVPVALLSEIREKLDRNAIRYWLDSFTISIDGKPATRFVNFGRAGNAERIQAILDEPA